MRTQKAVHEMEQVFKDAPYIIEHTNRVLRSAEYILDGEGITGATRETTELAAVLHDIGMIEAQRKHGNAEGHYQEIEGPPIARDILERIGAPKEMTNRVCYIVGCHHTPTGIDGVDFQILWEADYLEFLLTKEQGGSEDVRQKVVKNFQTAAGRKLAEERLGISP